MFWILKITQSYINSFKERNHATAIISGSSIVVGLSRLENGTIFANSDYRKGGTIAGY